MMPSRSFFNKFKWEFAFVAFLLVLSECFCSVDAQQMENNTVTTNSTSGTTTTPSAPSHTTKAGLFGLDDEHKMQMLIGGGVIAAIVMLIVVVLIVRCCCCKKRKRRHTSDDDNHNDQHEEEEHGKNKSPKPSGHKASTISAVPSDYKTETRLGATDLDVEAEVVPKTKPVPKKPKSKQIKHKLTSFFGSSSSTTKRPSAADHGVEVPETIRDDEDA
ncbi:hypothetical protein niasHS_001006 [Heterodera schachtii]|uniref:Uncharacterized protein n=1 Tax=Heterodera schachtii TaxID=97005 RepID=A0ABD2K7Y8_HETSC